MKEANERGTHSLKQVAVAQLEETHFWTLESFKLHRAWFKLYLVSLSLFLKIDFWLEDSVEALFVLLEGGWMCVCTIAPRH